MKARIGLLASTIALTLGALVASTTASAGDKHHDKHYKKRHRDVRYTEVRYNDVNYARVVDVDPIIRRVRVSAPERECWDERQEVSAGPSRTQVRSTLVGGLIGAAVGHRVGGRADIPTPVAIIGGSMIGAAVGNGIGERRALRNGDYDRPHYQTVQRCEVNYREEWAERIDGYRVTYLYHGREYTTRMPYDPGDRIRINVDVSPEVNGGYYR
ncbi:MAG: hypothetical protein H7Y02_05030 [Candidatus Obscuribacterales bacterium]|nr:hypothetical protein [Steroidobacteraceae bacterium]